MRSSTTPPAWSQHRVYCALPSVMRPRSLVRQELMNAAAPGPLTLACHLGKASVKGPGAAAFINSCLTNDLGRITEGKAQYTLCCDQSGGVVDDLSLIH